MEQAVKAEPTGPGRAAGGLGVTDRRDAWWVGPLLTALVLGIFIIYGTFRAFMNRYFAVGPYLSPFYSPDIGEWFGHEALFGLSPALFILPIPGLFRLTCYYYRKAYYRSFFLDPPGCAVGEPVHRRYRGETGFLIWQNAHRYVLYLAIIINCFLWVDVVRAFHHQGRVGVGTGSIVLLLSTTLLTGYTLSCHSLRHLVGGCRDCFSSGGGRLAYRLWKGASFMNERHMLWAWTSLFGVMFADFYVWMVASGTWSDWNTWGSLTGLR